MSMKDAQEMPKNTFNSNVKITVNSKGFEELKEECQNKSKTNGRRCSNFEPQEYLSLLYPKQSEILSKVRSKTLDIKDHQAYKYSDNICRWCNLETESVEHIVNYDKKPIELIDLIQREEIDDLYKLKIIDTVERIKTLKK